MRVPEGLKRLDDRVLGALSSAGQSPSGSAARTDDTHQPRSSPPDEQDPPREESRPVTTSKTGKTRETTEKTKRTEKTERAEADDAPRTPRGNGDGLHSFLTILWRVVRLVLLALALVLLVAIAFVLLPANEQNTIVSNVLSLAERVAGPFKDVFTLKNPDRSRIANYGLAAVVYFVASTFVGKLPTGSPRKKS